MAEEPQVKVAVNGSAAAAVADASFLGHPRGLATLFFTEMWERFSYYGIRALLILFMTAEPGAAGRGGLGFAVPKAGAIYGLYTAMVYMFGLPGGWVADRFLGQRRAVLAGGALIALGNFSLAVSSLTTFYLGLCLIVMGTGLLKPNVSAMVGQLYSASDARRDAGFSIFYMGINLGAFLSPLICGYLGQNVNWHLGFAMAGVGMILGLVQYVWGGKYLGEAGLFPARPEDAAAAARQKRQLLWGLGLGAGALGLLLALKLAGVARITAQGLNDAFGLILVLTVIFAFAALFLFGRWTPVERKRLVTIALLFIASALFWSVFEQAGSTLNLFADRNTDKHFLGLPFPASWFQSLNAVFIVTLAPVFAWLWVKLGSREPSSPAKFAFGLLFVGLGFGVLILAASLAASGVQVSPMWLLVTYLLHTVGELCLSPVGLSAMTKLAPARVTGLMMGVWFLSLSAGNYLGGRLASLYESLPLPHLFGATTAYALAAALVLALFAKPIRGLMGGVK